MGGYQVISYSRNSTNFMEFVCLKKNPVGCPCPDLSGQCRTSRTVSVKIIFNIIFSSELGLSKQTHSFTHFRATCPAHYIFLKSIIIFDKGYLSCSFVGRPVLSSLLGPDISYTLSGFLPSVIKSSFGQSILVLSLTLWSRNFLSNFSTPCI